MDLIETYLDAVKRPVVYAHRTNEQTLESGWSVDLVNYYVVFPRNKAVWNNAQTLSVLVSRGPKDEDFDPESYDEVKAKARTYLQRVHESEMRTRYRDFDLTNGVCLDDFLRSNVEERLTMEMEDYGWSLEQIDEWARLAVECTPQRDHTLYFLLEVFADYLATKLRRKHPYFGATYVS